MFKQREIQSNRRNEIFYFIFEKNQKKIGDLFYWL